MRYTRFNVLLGASRTLAIVAALITAGVVLASQPFHGKCVGVTDGDTISVMRDGRAVKVRLEGIDCPESGQDFSNAAKKYKSALAYGKTVEVRVTGTDRYGRVLAVVYADGTNVNLAIVQADLAWHFKRYSSDATLAAAENAARAAEIGLWSLPTPIPPWDWRSGQRELIPQKGKDGATVFHGNKSSHAFHKPTCRYYWCKNCVVEFTTRDEAISAGYRPCGHCRP
jgi:endonuclease YncB( thermonuclease family)